MLALCLGVLGASLLGSLHCVGMCGGFVAMYAGDAGAANGLEQPGPKEPQYLAHLSYSMGRWLAYVLLGVAFGGAGAALDLAGRAAGLQRTAIWVGGGLLLVWGGAMLLRQVISWRWSSALPLSLQRLLLRLHRYAHGKSPRAKGFLLGIMSGILPCGWLYAFVLTAAATGSAWRGGLIMTAFWLGTLPAMLGLGFGMRWLSLKLGRLLPTLSAVTVIALGTYALVFRAQLSASALTQRALQTSQALTPQQQLERTQMMRKRGHCACSKKPGKRRIAPRVRQGSRARPAPQRRTSPAAQAPARRAPVLRRSPSRPTP